MRILKKDIWPYQAFIKMPLYENSDELIKIKNWCNNSAGKRFVDWYDYSSHRTTVYTFKNKDTFLIFKLIWGNYVSCKNDKECN